MKMKIALSGKMASGKSTVLKELAKFYEYKGVAIGNEIKPLAASLIENKQGFKEKIQRVIPNPKQRVKALTEILQFFYVNFQNANWVKDENGVYLKNEPYRKLLQDFPMLIRNHFGEEIFAKLLLTELQSDIEKGSSIICDDLRLPNEKKLFEQKGFKIIRLDIEEEEQKRRLIKTYGTFDEAALRHRTEVALDNENFDLRIDVTHKSVPAIVEEIKNFLCLIGWG